MGTRKEESIRRDKFAALAMQALIIKGGSATHKEIADCSVRQADLLIKALDKRA